MLMLVAIVMTGIPTIDRLISIPVENRASYAKAIRVHIVNDRAL